MHVSEPTAEPMALNGMKLDLLCYSDGTAALRGVIWTVRSIIDEPSHLRADEILRFHMLIGAPTRIWSSFCPALLGGTFGHKTSFYLEFSFGNSTHNFEVYAVDDQNGGTLLRSEELQILDGDTDAAWRRSF